jgi:galactokinase/mevalonate kinase-like predicted kinase
LIVAKPVCSTARATVRPIDRNVKTVSQSAAAGAVFGGGGGGKLLFLKEAVGGSCTKRTK